MPDQSLEKSQRKQQVDRIVRQLIGQMPLYKKIKNPPQPGDAQYVSVVSEIILEVIKDKYKRTGLEDVVSPPPLSTVKGWFYKGFPPEVVISLGQ